MYPEVRSAVSNTDDPSLPVETFRSYFLGILFAILFSAMNQVSIFIPFLTISSSLFVGPWLP
jgi:hypothetical protein